MINPLLHVLASLLQPEEISVFLDYSGLETGLSVWQVICAPVLPTIISGWFLSLPCWHQCKKLITTLAI